MDAERTAIEQLLCVAEALCRSHRPLHAFFAMHNYLTHGQTDMEGDSITARRSACPKRVSNSRGDAQPGYGLCNGPKPHPVEAIGQPQRHGSPRRVVDLNTQPMLPAYLRQEEVLLRVRAAECVIFDNPRNDDAVSPNDVAVGTAARDACGSGDPTGHQRRPSLGRVASQEGLELACGVLAPLFVNSVNSPTPFAGNELFFNSINVAMLSWPATGFSLHLAEAEAVACIVQIQPTAEPRPVPLALLLKAFLLQSTVCRRRHQQYQQARGYHEAAQRWLQALSTSASLRSGAARLSEELWLRLTDEDRAKVTLAAQASDTTDGRSWLTDGVTHLVEVELRYCRALLSLEMCRVQHCIVHSALNFQMITASSTHAADPRGAAGLQDARAAKRAVIEGALLLEQTAALYQNLINDGGSTGRVTHPCSLALRSAVVLSLCYTPPLEKGTSCTPTSGAYSTCANFHVQSVVQVLSFYYCYVALLRLYAPADLAQAAGNVRGRRGIPDSATSTHMQHSNELVAEALDRINACAKAQLSSVPSDAASLTSSSENCDSQVGPKPIELGLLEELLQLSHHANPVVHETHSSHLASNTPVPSPSLQGTSRSPSVTSWITPGVVRAVRLYMKLYRSAQCPSQGPTKSTQLKATPRAPVPSPVSMFMLPQDAEATLASSTPGMTLDAPSATAANFPETTTAPHAYAVPDMQPPFDRVVRTSESILVALLETVDEELMILTGNKTRTAYPSRWPRPPPALIPGPVQQTSVKSLPNGTLSTTSSEEVSSNPPVSVHRELRSRHRAEQRSVYSTNSPGNLFSHQMRFVQSSVLSQLRFLVQLKASALHTMTSVCITQLHTVRAVRYLNEMQLFMTVFYHHLRGHCHQNFKVEMHMLCAFVAMQLAVRDVSSLPGGHQLPPPPGAHQRTAGEAQDDWLSHDVGLPYEHLHTAEHALLTSQVIPNHALLLSIKLMKCLSVLQFVNVGERVEFYTEPIPPASSVCDPRVTSSVQQAATLSPHVGAAPSLTTSPATHSRFGMLPPEMKRIKLEAAAPLSLGDSMGKGQCSVESNEEDEDSEDTLPPSPLGTRATSWRASVQPPPPIGSASTRGYAVLPVPESERQRCGEVLRDILASLRASYEQDLHCRERPPLWKPTHVAMYHLLTGLHALTIDHDEGGAIKAFKAAAYIAKKHLGTLNPLVADALQWLSSCYDVELATAASLTPQQEDRESAHPAAGARCLTHRGISEEERTAAIALQVAVRSSCAALLRFQRRAAAAIGGSGGLRPPPKSSGSSGLTESSLEVLEWWATVQTRQLCGALPDARDAAVLPASAPRRKDLVKVLSMLPPAAAYQKFDGM